MMRDVLFSREVRTLIAFLNGLAVGTSAWAGSDAIRCIERELEWHLSNQAPTKSGFPVRSLINPGKIKPTVASVVQAKHKPVNEVLAELGVPEYAHPYFGADGRFKYRPDKPIHLSVENGDEELLAAKIHFADDTNFSFQKVFQLLVADYLRVLKEIPQMELIAVLNSRDPVAFEKLIRSAPESVRKRVKSVVIDQNIVPHPWSQDGAKPVRVPSGSAMQALVPIDQSNARTLKAIWNELEKKDWAIRRSIFDFDGGDVVVGERHVFVGPKVVQKNMERLKISHAEALDGLSAEFGKPVFEIKQNVVPTAKVPHVNEPIDYHIDVFFAVARNHKTGKETVLLTSPELGMKALAGKRRNSDLSSDWNTMCEELVRGAKADPYEELNEAESALLKTLRNMDHRLLREQQDQVNAEAVRLRSLGYDVKFIPGIAQADPYRIDYAWEIFSYANVNFSGKKAIVPQLGIPALDLAATQVFEEGLGYQVIHVHSPTKSLCTLGGIRCMTETYRRSGSQ